jgi:hypothetical protein
MPPNQGHSHIDKLNVRVSSQHGQAWKAPLPRLFNTLMRDIIRNDLSRIARQTQDIRPEKTKLKKCHLLVGRTLTKPG